MYDDEEHYSTESYNQEFSQKTTLGPSKEACETEGT